MDWQWTAQAQPILSPGAKGKWDSSDVLNPSVLEFDGQLLNLYSGFDGKTWHTGLAVSPDGIAWTKRGKILSPDPATWEGDYIAANGSELASNTEVLYWYQAGRPPQIGLARSTNLRDWQKQPKPVLESGPFGSWDERGVADPCAIRSGKLLYMFYTGTDRARRQRLGVAGSLDGITWFKQRQNPIMELGEYGSFDEGGLGEPAAWASNGYYWMLYTGRDRKEYRRLGLACSLDGVHWEKLPKVFAGSEPWNAKVICDPSVLVEGDRVRVWFGGGDVASPDENLHGQIGIAELRPARKN